MRRRRASRGRGNVSPLQRRLVCRSLKRRWHSTRNSPCLAGATRHRGDGLALGDMEAGVESGAPDIGGERAGFTPRLTDSHPSDAAIAHERLPRSTKHSPERGQWCLFLVVASLKLGLWRLDCQGEGKTIARGCPACLVAGGVSTEGAEPPAVRVLDCGDFVAFVD